MFLWGHSWVKYGIMCVGWDLNLFCEPPNHGNGIYYTGVVVLSLMVIPLLHIDGTLGFTTWCSRYFVRCQG